jgi:hypothetical protein
MNPENVESVIPEPMQDPESAVRVTNTNKKRRGRDILEVYPNKYKKLENGQIIKVKVDSVVSA